MFGSKKRLEEKEMLRRALREEISAELKDQFAAKEDAIYAGATDRAKELLLKDPIFAEAYRKKLEFDQHQRELDQVLDFGMTARVIEKLVEESTSRRVCVTITWPLVLGDDGVKTGGQVMTIQPQDEYQAMRKRVESMGVPF